MNKAELITTLKLKGFKLEANERIFTELSLGELRITVYSYMAAITIPGQRTKPCPLNQVIETLEANLGI